MPRAEGSLWDLNLGLANVPALPTSGEKDFMKLLIQLLAATFQARLCPTKCPCLMLQTQWSNKKNLGQISSILWVLGTMPVPSVLLQKILGNADLATLRLLTFVILTVLAVCQASPLPHPWHILNAETLLCLEQIVSNKGWKPGTSI